MNRAIFFIDGNNWYHSLKGCGLTDLQRLSYPHIFDKLAGAARTWSDARYYIPDVGSIGSAGLLAEQREFLKHLRSLDARISVHMGRLEPRTSESEAAKELLQYLGGLKVRLDLQVYKDLVAIGRAHRHTRVFVEKAIDVQIAVDMVQFAIDDKFDVAYLLSADGDYTPAVEAVKGRGKKVFSATPGACAKLAAVVNTHIPLRRTWFSDCYLGGPPG
jgi:uncharacterized LabA/DUF88 family protein